MLLGAGMAESVARMAADLQPSVAMDPFAFERFKDLD